MSDADPHGPLPARAPGGLAGSAALFGATSLSCALAGMYFAEGDPFSAASWRDMSKTAGALSYAVAALAILWAHEMGHYLTARRAGVEVSRPIFLPGIPLPGGGIAPLFGTFGAFIGLSWRPMPPRTLLRIGALGPIWGMAICLPVLAIGYALSEVRALPAPGEGGEGVLRLGESALTLLMGALFFGRVPQGSDIFLHPLAMAGWMGCFLTAFNLIPVGQLDGGHIAYAIFGERWRSASWGAWGALVVCGVFVWPGWLALAALTGWMGVRHPPLCADAIVERGERGLAWVCAGLLAATITARPIEAPSLWAMARDLLA